MRRLNTVNPSIDGKYIAPAAAEGKLEVEPSIGPDLAQALAVQRISIRGLRTHNVKYNDLDNPHSTVDTVTEIRAYLRPLFARVGAHLFPNHNRLLQAQSVSELVDRGLALPEDTKIRVLVPLARERKGEFVELFAKMRAHSCVSFRVDGQSY